MKLKLIVPLLALCLALTVVSVQAQSNVLGNMNDVNLIMTGNVTETVRCNIVGNATIIEEMTPTGNVSGVTGNMANNTGNMTGHMTGKMVLIRDMDNMTEKAVIVGTPDNVPGTIVIFGRTANITRSMTSTTGNMTNTTGNMTNVTSNVNVPKNMIILTTGNVTGTITFKEAGGMTNTTGNRTNVTSSMNVPENITILATGDMTGNITGDMTKKVVVIRNIGNIAGVSRTIGNITEMGAANTTGPMTLDLTGKMVVIRNMDTRTRMNTENIEDIIAMDGDVAILENAGNMTGMNQNMNSVTGKVVTITNLDNVIGITTDTITCNATQTRAMIRNMGSMI